MNKRKKTVFVITQFYPPDFAPTGQLIQELITSFDQVEHEIKVFAGQLLVAPEILVQVTPPLLLTCH